MKFKKWIQLAAASALLATTVASAPIAKAEEKRKIADESIYDLLVDRYFNSTNTNDGEGTDPTNPNKFAGGDFEGIIQKLIEIRDMGFTIVSIGSIFKTEQYDGSMITSYSEFEPNFGTEEEFKKLIKDIHKHNMSIMVDFPLTNVSANHEWAQDPSKASWIVGETDGILRWDLNNPDLQQALIDTVVDFITTYDVDGIRLTNLDIASNEFLNEMITAIKEAKDIYVISNEESDANFDAKFYGEVSEIFRNIYKNVDEDSSELLKYVEPYASGKDEIPTQIMIDDLNTDRFVYSTELYPPTRLRMALTTNLLLPGVPVMQYGTEIAMNGEAGPEAHQLYNFKTDNELKEYIGKIQKLRKQSDTIRNGEFKLITNEDGLLVFQRVSDEENWIIIVNNTSKRQRIELSEDIIGENKELRGLLYNEIYRVGDDGIFRIIQDREFAEIYQVIDERGINFGYVIAMLLVYVIFIGFIVSLMRRAKRKREASNS